MNLIKIFSPFTGIDRYLKKKTVETLELNDGDHRYDDREEKQYFSSQFDGNDGGRIQSIAINGENLIYFHTVDNLLLIFDSNECELMRIVRLDCRGASLKRVECLNRNWLLVQTTTGMLFIVNGDDFKQKCLIEGQGVVHRINCNDRNGGGRTWFGVIKRTGEIAVKELDFYVNRVRRHHRNVEYCKETRVDNNVALLDRLYRDVSRFLNESRTPFISLIIL